MNRYVINNCYNKMIIETQQSTLSIHTTPVITTVQLTNQNKIIKPKTLYNSIHKHTKLLDTQ